MTENTFNVVYDYTLNDRNETFVNHLNECIKKIELLESYRKFLIRFSDECICNNSSVIKCLVKSLENRYQNTFSSSHGSDDVLDNSQPSFDQNSGVTQELDTRIDSNDRNVSSEETNQQKYGNFHKNNDLVLVFNKINKSLTRKTRDCVQTNTELIINKFVLKKSMNISESDSSSQLKSISKITQPLIDKNCKQLLNKRKSVVTSSGDHKLKRSRKTVKLNINSNKKSNKPKILSKNIIDGHKPEEYKLNNQIFNDLVEDLKNGKIDSFFDKNHNLIKVSLQNDNSNEEKKVVFNCIENGCHFVSHTIQSARRHVRRHNKDKLFVCQLCNKRFVIRAYLSQHLEFVHNSKGKPQIECEFPGCQFKSISKSQLKTHYFTHSDERTVRCHYNGCDSYFKSVSLMRAHMKIHNENREFVCQWSGCEASFKSKAYLKRHLEIHKGNGLSNTKLKDVLQTGNYLSTVDRNNNMFSVIRQQDFDLNNGKIGIGAKLGFKCNHSGCQFASIFKHLMTQHVSTHLFGKTFECNLCDKKFGLAKYLTQHKNTVHNINNSPVICCPVPDCQYKTTYKLGLRTHSLTHQMEKPFKCDYSGCLKRFKTEVLLRWHKNSSHLKSKPFVCDYTGCHLAFEVKDQLKRHIKCHTKTFQCHFNDCSKSYKKKQDLNRHIRQKH